MSQITWQTIKDFHDAPTTCGVYQYWKNGDLLYIGKAINLKARLSSHAQNAKLDVKEAAIVTGDTIKYTLCDTEFKALMLESKLIRTLKPPHNRSWKDDKSYLYIVLDLVDPFPRPKFARAHDLITSLESLPTNQKVFGPFPSANIAEEVLRAIRRLIPFCMSKRVTSRPCFYSRIGLCNPCPSGNYKGRNLVKKQYRGHIKQVIKILEGNVDPVIKDLTLEMKKFSANEDFESALKIRTSIERFTRFITTHSFTDRHFSYNNAAKKIDSLRSVLSAYLGDQPLDRIECYDASNSSIYDSVVSMTVMTNGLLDNGQYRRFRIKNPLARSDFDRLDEALVRRLKNKGWEKPDLIVIDGGVPQLRRLQKIFDKESYPPRYLGLAKHPDRLVIPSAMALNFLISGSQPAAPDFLTIKLPPDHPGLQLLQQLRDEAHRYANAYRKILEKKRTRI